MTTADFRPRPLPAAAVDLCTRLAAPPGLVAHLEVVHDAAVALLEALDERFPELPIDREAVLFGAATHDLGKARHLAELVRAGRRHEQDGPALLESLGASPALARFARTHNSWREDDDLTLEDWLVALADHAWRGDRPTELEMLVAEAIAERTGEPDVGVFVSLDDALVEVSLDAAARLAWQRRAEG